MDSVHGWSKIMDFEHGLVYGLHKLTIASIPG